VVRPIDPSPSAWTRAKAWCLRAPASLPIALAFATWYSLGQAEVLLRQYQQADTLSFGVAALGGGLVPRPATARDAVDLWVGPSMSMEPESTESQAAAFLWAYTFIDVLFILVLVWLTVVALTRLTRARDALPEVPSEGVYTWYAQPWWGKDDDGWRRWRPLPVFVVADLLEDAFRIVVFYTADSSEVASGIFVVLAWAAEKVKWAAVLLILLTLVAGWREVRELRTRDQRTRSESHERRSVKILRGQLAIVAVFALMLLIDVTGQVGDIVRRWVDTPSSGAIGLLALALLCLVLWSSCRRIILAKARTSRLANTADAASRALRIGVALSVVPAVILAIAFHSPIPFALPLLGVVLLILETARRIIGFRAFDTLDAKALESTTASSRAQDAAPRASLQRVARFAAAVPVVVTGIVMVKAGVGPLILTFTSESYGIWSGLVLVLLGIALVFTGCLAVPPLLARWDISPPGRALEYRHLALAAITLVAAACLILLPLTAPLAVGSLAVFAVAFALIGLIVAELQRFSEVTVPPRGLAMLRFRRVPVFTLLAVWFLIATALDTDSDYHDIRTTGQVPRETDLGDVWDAWLSQNCVDESEGPVPLVLVTAHGGGIRAAYWTASVLTALELEAGVDGCDSASASSRVFALSGLSGGSVGAAAFYSQPTDADSDWFEGALGEPDYAAVALSSGLFVDLPRTLVGYDTPDRAARLETAWEDHIENFDEDYFQDLHPGPHGDGRWVPITILNGAQVETGCRVSVSAIRLTASSPAQTGDCRADVQRASTLTLDARMVPGSGVVVPAAAVTVDALAVSSGPGCNASFRSSTAALLSARWPYISPSGGLPCADPPVSVVDGGYADGAGNAALLDLWRQMEPLIADHNAQIDDDDGLVVPVLVVVDNHYQNLSEAPAVDKTSEFLVPPLTYTRASGTRSPDREQEVISALAAGLPGRPDWYCDVPGSEGGKVLLAPVTRPGLPAPLAWTLAESSRLDLDDQRADLFADEGVGTVVRGMLTGTGSPVTCQRAE
jgi:hypothetical protein